jgi:aryl-alcohol dehydrogenase-like predicted oxidoreductase
LNVSRIGLGLAALGRPGYINLGHAQDLGEDYAIESMEQNAHVVLDAAWKGGVFYFDAARSYGRGEQFLGSWLRSRAIPNNAVAVGSKWGYTYTADWTIAADVHEVKEHSLAVLQRQWGETKTNLGDYLRIYQIHSATFASGVLENQAVLNELARLKGTGVLVGLSLSGPDQPAVLRRAADVLLDGVRLFDCVQITWNLLEPSAGPELASAHAQGMGVIVKEALANGRLTPKNNVPAFAEKMSVLGQQAARLETTIDALALAGVLAQPWADVVLSGAATTAHIASNLNALHVQWDAEADRELSVLVETPPEYWKKRSALPWN